MVYFSGSLLDKTGQNTSKQDSPNMSDVCTQEKFDFGFGFWVGYYTQNPKIFIPKTKT